MLGYRAHLGMISERRARMRHVICAAVATHMLPKPIAYSTDQMTPANEEEHNYDVMSDRSFDS